MPAWGPSRPLCQLAGSRVVALWYDPPLSGGRRPLTHSPRRVVVSGPANTEGAHPTASGRLALAVTTQPLRDVSWEVSSEVTKVPLAELRRLFVMESKLSECMERKDRKKMVKCRER